MEEIQIKVEDMDSEEIDWLEIEYETEDMSVSVTDNTEKAFNMAIAEEDYRLKRIKFSDLFELKEIGPKKVLEWCMNEGLIASSYICPQCDKIMKLYSISCQDDYMWFCYNKQENHSVCRSVRNGSVFSGSKLHLADILIIIHCWIYKMPFEWILLELDCTKKTLVEWEDYCRDICLEIGAKDDRTIGGKSKVVEIIGGKFATQRPRDDEIKELFVFAGIEDMYAEISFIRLVEKCDKSSFIEVIKNSVLPGTTILSDFYDDFNCIEDEDFENLAMNNSYQFKDPETFAEEQISKQRKSFWSTIKNQLPKHCVKKGFFDNYLAEFMWRKKYSSVYDKMRKFILALKTVYPPTGTDSIGPEWFEKPSQ